MFTEYIFGCLFAFAAFLAWAAGSHEEHSHKGAEDREAWKELWEEPIWMVFVLASMLSWLAFIVFLCLCFRPNQRQY